MSLTISQCHLFYHIQTGIDTSFGYLSVLSFYSQGNGNENITWGFDMELTKWSYAKKYNIKAQFNDYPNSIVVFRKIKNYYFVYTVHWSWHDPVVTREALEEMERLLNQELGTEHEYRLRKYQKNSNEK